MLLPGPLPAPFPTHFSMQHSMMHRTRNENAVKKNQLSNFGDFSKQRCPFNDRLKQIYNLKNKKNISFRKSRQYRYTVLSVLYVIWINLFSFFLYTDPIRNHIILLDPDP